MIRAGNVYYKDEFVGKIIEDEDGFRFEYENINSPQISLSLPNLNKPHKSKVLFPFFDGLIPEGWLLDIAKNNWKLNSKDRMGLLLVCCNDCIGAVSVKRK